MVDELEDFVACGEKFTRFREHRSMPLTGGFGRMKFDEVEKLATQKCKLIYFFQNIYAQRQNFNFAKIFF